MKNIPRNITQLFTLLITGLLVTMPMHLFAQDVLESNTPGLNESAALQVFEETIRKISPSKRIYILSNDTKNYGPGDYITFIIDNELAARAIVAKLTDQSAGIKVIKVYSIEKWNKIREGLRVQIIRGDDSGWKGPEELAQARPNDLRNLDEDQLFDDSTFLSGDLNFKNNAKRLIKTDNLIGLYFGRISSLDNDGGDKSYTHYSATWGYQFLDNIWVQLMVGQALLEEYPQVTTDPNSNGLETVLTTFTVRLKYTIKIPFESFVQPYLGFQIRNAASDGAGEGVANQNTSSSELQQVDDAEGNSIIFGATMLKRLVPGWFVTLDLGTDIINLGLNLEF